MHAIDIASMPSVRHALAWLLLLSELLCAALQALDTQSKIYLKFIVLRFFVGFLAGPITRAMFIITAPY